MTKGNKNAFSLNGEEMTVDRQIPHGPEEKNRRRVKKLMY